MDPAARHRGARLVVAVVVALATVGSVRSARGGEVGDCEERIFRWFNRRGDGVAGPLWMLMQAGSLGAVYALAGEAARRGRPKSAALVAVYGTGAWAGVKLVKPGVRRGRPADHLDDVVVRGERQRGLGYPSGHAAVAMTVGLMAPRAVGFDDRPEHHLAALGLAAATGATRMYVGAHLPLDVVGGIAIGVGAGRLGTALLARWGDDPSPRRR